MALPFYLSTQTAESYILPNIKKEKQLSSQPKYRLSFTKQELVTIYLNLPDNSQVKIYIGNFLMKLHHKGL